MPAPHDDPFAALADGLLRYWPLLVGLIAMIGWLARLEVRVGGIEEWLKRVEEKLDRLIDKLL